MRARKGEGCIQNLFFAESQSSLGEAPLHSQGGVPMQSTKACAFPASTDYLSAPKTGQWLQRAKSKQASRPAPPSRGSPSPRSDKPGHGLPCHTARPVG